VTRTAVRVTYARVRRAAQLLLAEQVEPPVDLDRIVANAGVEIRVLDLAPDISGILYRDEERRVVVVNAAHGSARRRFTIAHELGHLSLHRGVAVHVDETFRVNLRSPRSTTAEDVEEIEANAFAANLLMPAAWLRRDFESGAVDWHDEGEVHRLAARYLVSPQAMLLRLTSLFSD
jgi:Zn-dependent peptidase ImmA (M78 family)